MLRIFTRRKSHLWFRKKPKEKPQVLTPRGVIASEIQWEKVQKKPSKGEAWSTIDTNGKKTRIEIRL